MNLPKIASSLKKKDGVKIRVQKAIPEEEEFSRRITRKSRGEKRMRAREFRIRFSRRYSGLNEVWWPEGRVTRRNG